MVTAMYTYLSPLILWRFRCGLAPGVLSLCDRWCISRSKALSTASGSKALDRADSLGLLLC